MNMNLQRWLAIALSSSLATVLTLPANVSADEPPSKDAAAKADGDGDGDKPSDNRRRGDREGGDRERGDRERGDRDAQSSESRDERRGNPIMVVRMMMEKFDKDGDDKLNREELAAALTAMREAGGPGALFGGAGPGGPGFGGPGFGGPGFGAPGAGLLGAGGGRIFDQMDADKDGKLSGDEIPERLRQGIARVDTNGDGAIEKSELQSMAERFRGRRPGGDQPRDGQDNEGNRRPRRPDAE